MLFNKYFLSSPGWLAVGCQPIKIHVWNYLLTNINFNMGLVIPVILVGYTQKKTQNIMYVSSMTHKGGYNDARRLANCCSVGLLGLELSCTMELPAVIQQYNDTSTAPECLALPVPGSRLNHITMITLQYSHQSVVTRSSTHTYTYTLTPSSISSDSYSAHVASGISI